MTKYVSGLVLVLCLGGLLVSCNEVQKSNNDLPTEANSFMNAHFKETPIIQINTTSKKMDYETVLENGTEINYNSMGEWEEINFKWNPVPQSFLSELPKKIINFIEENYPDETIHKIERKHFGRKDLIYRIQFHKPNDIEISFSQEGDLISDNPNEKRLPSATKAFIKKHYPESQIVSIVDDVDGDFEVRLDNKTELDFDRKGVWFQLDSKKKPFPNSIIEILPTEMIKYILKNYPEQFIKEVEKKSYGYRVTLNKPNNVELCFTGSGILIEKFEPFSE
ncbi:MAG: PepSY-like domain-containing protein [Paludibacteraceae bacterium]|nr:PepSY-like domain-containing protein [Paludibacteraceae bacterium]